MDHAGSAGTPAIDWWVLGSGGAPASGGGNDSNASFGQTAIGLSSSGGTNLSSGFWYGANNLVYQNGFDNPAGDEWRCTTRNDTTPAGARKFLGQFGNETACLVLENLPYHTALKITFDLYIIRTWNGNQLDNKEEDPRPSMPNEPEVIVGRDEWQLLADGTTLLHTTFANWPIHDQSYPDGFLLGSHPAGTGASEKNTLGYLYYETPKESKTRVGAWIM